MMTKCLTPGFLTAILPFFLSPLNTGSLERPESYDIINLGELKKKIIKKIV